MDRLVATDSTTLISKYEERVQKLEMDKAVLQEKAVTELKKTRSFKGSLRTVLEFFRDPYQLWLQADWRTTGHC